VSKLRLQTEGQGREVSEAWTRFLQVKPLVHGPQDFFRFQRMCQKGEGKLVRNILERRAKRIISAWMQTFGVKRGVPPRQDPVLFCALGIYKERTGKSWGELAKMVNPSLMREKPTRNSVQQAVGRAEAVVRAKRRKE